MVLRLPPDACYRQAVSQLPLAGFRSVRGQPRAVELLARAVAQGRLASAYLFEGPDGVGKERTARALAQVTVCTDRQPDGDACGRCSPCRQVAEHRHVDVITVAREIDLLSQEPHAPSEIRSEIVKEKIVELQRERLVYHSHQGTRWVIVRNADELSPSAANAFLKTLEEPPARTHMVLITAHPSRLLTTIRSRCQRVRFVALDVSVVEEILLAAGIAPEVARDAARFSDGSVSRALRYADAEAMAARRTWVHRLLTALRAGRPGGYVEVSEALKELGKSDNDEVVEILEWLERHFRDEAIALVAEQPRRAVVCAARAELVRQTAESLDRNVNLQLALENMLVRLREVRG